MTETDDTPTVPLHLRWAALPLTLEPTRYPAWSRPTPDGYDQAQGFIGMALGASGADGQPREDPDEVRTATYRRILAYGYAVDLPSPQGRTRGDTVAVQLGTLLLAGNLAALTLAYRVAGHPETRDDEQLHRAMDRVVALLWPGGKPAEPGTDSVHAGLALRRYCRATGQGIDAYRGIDDLAKAACATGNPPAQSTYPAALHHLVRSVANRSQRAAERPFLAAALTHLVAGAPFRPE